VSDETPGLSAYPEWGDLYDEPADAAVAFVIEQALGEGDGIDLEPRRASLAGCLSDARECYLMEYWDWLGRSRREGEPHRPYRDERHNDGGSSPYDYGEFRAPPSAWLDHWDQFFAKPVSATGSRARNPGKFRDLKEHDPPLGKPMLAGVYHRLNRWWRAELGTPFRPNFDGMASADTDHARMPHLNPAARLFVLFAQEVDRRFTVAHCARVDSEEARRQRAGK
jgi:hypothetical protein